MKKIAFYYLLLSALLITSTWAAAPNPKVRLETNKGNIVIELNQKAAPQTVKNFLTYTREGFYNGTIFHRVIKGFMIQGGGMTADMKQKDTNSPVPNEADNGLKNTKGTLAMARTGNPHSATAQFFINTVNNPSLDHTQKNPQGWGYCVFGKVVEGMDVVMSIEQSPTTSKFPHQNVPATPILIKKATIIEQPQNKK